MEIKDTGYKGEVLLFYLEDNGEPTSAYVHIIDIKDGLITFQTSKNIISIPTSRIIKIKQKSNGK